MLRTAFATLVVVFVFGAVLWEGTDGLRAFTAEGARRLSVTEQPWPVPAVRLIDMRGRELTFADEVGRSVVVEFMYTTCPTICVALGESFAKLRDQIRIAGLADRVRLISISFDLRDSPEALEDYAQAHGADGGLWITARPEDERALRALLMAFASLLYRMASAASCTMQRSTSLIGGAGWSRSSISEKRLRSSPRYGANRERNCCQRPAPRGCWGRPDNGTAPADFARAT